MRPPITPFFVVRFVLGYPTGWFLILSSFFTFFWIVFVPFSSVLGIESIFIFAIPVFIFSLYISIKNVLRINFLVQNWNATEATFSHHKINSKYEERRILFFKYLINGKEYTTHFKRFYQTSDMGTVIVDERDYKNQILLYNPKNPNEVVFVNEEPHAVRDYLYENKMLYPKHK